MEVAADSHRERDVVDRAFEGTGSVSWYAGHVSASLAIDDLLRSTGVHLRALTMPSFMDNMLYAPRRTPPASASGSGR